jgi:hypothetical protein
MEDHLLTNCSKFSYPRGIVLMTSILLLISSSSCGSDGDGSSNDASALVRELLAKSEPDECFCGIGFEDSGPINNSVTGDCSDLTPEGTQIHLTWRQKVGGSFGG